MQIDWLTVGAQLVNFLVLVWLLQRFLYGPITRAMARREERIEGRLREARESREAAEAEAERLRERQEELDRQREEFLDEARAEAKALRERLEQEARDEVDEARSGWRRQVEAERADFLRELRRRTAAHVHELARTALAELADAELEERVAARFRESLRELVPDRARKMAEAARGESGTVRIESALELSPGMRGQLTRAVHEHLGEDLETDHARAEDLVLGIRLRAGAQVLEWSLSSYLARVESAVAEKLDEARPAPEEQAA